jgi:hypothetical protein
MVLAFAMIRLSWPKRPLYAVLLLIWFTHAGRMLSKSFLDERMIKSRVTLIGLVYWLVTGLPPKTFSILPSRRS